MLRVARRSCCHIGSTCTISTLYLKLYHVLLRAIEQDAKDLAFAYRILGLAILVTGLPSCYFLKARVTGRVTGKINLRLFRNSSFALLFGTGILAMFAVTTVPSVLLQASLATSSLHECISFFLPSYIEAMGYSASDSAYALAGYNLCSVSAWNMKALFK